MGYWTKREMHEGCKAVSTRAQHTIYIEDVFGIYLYSLKRPDMLQYLSY